MNSTRVVRHPVALRLRQGDPVLWKAAGLILLFNGLLLLWLLLRPGNESLVKAVDNVAQFLGPLLAIPLCLSGGRIPWWPRKPRSPTRVLQSCGSQWVFTVLALSILSESVGQIIWTYYEQILHQ